MAGSDFLSGLLDRAQGRAPVLERRRPSMFEPSHPTSGMGMGLVEAGEFVDAEDAPAPRRRTAAPESAPDLPMRAKAVPVVEEPPAARVRKPAEIQEPVRPPLRPHVAASSKTVETRTVRETIVERQIEKSAIEIRVATPKPPAVDAPAIAAIRPASAPVRHEDEARPKPVALLPEHPQPGKSLPPAARPAIQPATRRAAAAKPRPAPAEPMEAAAPTIHVTIGRVEVRAVPAAALAPGAVRPFAPKLNLEDYLRSRGGGRG
jgi:hypothetical protein